MCPSGYATCPSLYMVYYLNFLFYALWTIFFWLFYFTYLQNFFPTYKRVQHYNYLFKKKEEVNFIVGETSIYLTTSYGLTFY